MMRLMLFMFPYCSNSLLPSIFLPSACLYAECISSWLLVFLIHDEVNALYVPILFKLSPQFTLACVIVDSSGKKGFERVASFFLRCIWIPNGNFLFQLVCHLFSFLLLSPFPPFFSGFHLDRCRSVNRVLKEMDILSDTLIVVSLSLFVGELSEGREKGDGVSWCE